MQSAAKHNGAPLVALLAGACMAFALLPESFNQWLALDREAIRHGEWWRLWTAHLAHFSPQHAAIDALVCFIAGGIVEKRMGSRWIAWALAGIGPLISIGLLLWSPDLVQYRGLSGVAMALTVVAMISIAREYPAYRLAVALLAVVLAVKVVGEALEISIGFAGLPDGVLVEWRAHVLGALVGVAFSCGEISLPNSIRLSPTLAPRKRRA